MTVRSSANGSDPTSASSGGETSPVWLKTDSHDRTTAGHAAAGGSAPGAFSILRTGAESGADAGQPASAVVKAVSTVQNLVVGDALKIAEIRTELTIRQGTGAKPEVTVHRQITGMSVGGTAAEMGPDGFVMAGSKAPLPQPALDALKAAGIEVRAGEQKAVAGGVSVSGLVIRRPFDFSQMSGGQLPLSVPKTMVVEMAFGVASGQHHRPHRRRDRRRPVVLPRSGPLGRRDIDGARRAKRRSAARSEGVDRAPGGGPLCSGLGRGSAGVAAGGRLGAGGQRSTAEEGDGAGRVAGGDRRHRHRAAVGDPPWPSSGGGSVKRYWKWAVSQWDRVIGWTCVGGGALLTLSGALNVSRARDQLDQLSYLASGPAIGLFLLGLGAILILSADLRDEWGKLDEVMSELRRPSSPAEISLVDAPIGSPKDAPDSPSDGSAAPATEAPVNVVALRAGLPALALAGGGILGGATGVNQSLNRASALHWTQLSGASLALTLLVVGFLYLRSRAAVQHRVAGVLGAPTPVAAGGPGGTAVTSAAPGQWFVVDGSQRYHAAGCDLLRYSEARAVPAGEAAAAGLARCPICR